MEHFCFGICCCSSARCPSYFFFSLPAVLGPACYLLVMLQRFPQGRLIGLQSMVSALFFRLRKQGSPKHHLFLPCPVNLLHASWLSSLVNSDQNTRQQAHEITQYFKGVVAIAGKGVWGTHMDFKWIEHWAIWILVVKPCVFTESGCFINGNVVNMATFWRCFSYFE